LPLTEITYNVGLQGYSQIQVAVAARTAKGIGPYSSASVIQTPTDGKAIDCLADKSLASELNKCVFIHALVPSAPEDITYTIVTDTAIQLQWSPPDTPNGIIRSYQVFYHGYRLNQSNETGNVSHRSNWLFCKQ